MATDLGRVGQLTFDPLRARRRSNQGGVERDGVERGICG